jgi:hypothetical protein
MHAMSVNVAPDAVGPMLESHPRLRRATGGVGVHVTATGQARELAPRVVGSYLEEMMLETAPRLRAAQRESAFWRAARRSMEPKVRDTVRATLDSWFIRLPGPARAQIRERFADAHLPGAAARRGVAP